MQEVYWDISQHQTSINIDFEAVLAKDLPNGMKSGDTMKLGRQSKFSFKDGKIVRIVDIS